MGIILLTASTMHARDLTREEVAGLIQKARRKYPIPSMAIIVMNADRILISEIQGFRAMDSNDAVKIDDYYHIGSCSKSILAVIAGKLVEQGELTWKTRFFDVYPELSATATEAYLDITLEDLLGCRAGIQPFTSGEAILELEPSISHSRPAFINYLIQQPASGQTESGFEFLYSNASYTMAAAIVERVSGLTWEALIQETLSKDLGLSVIFGWPNNYHQNQPWGHLNLNGREQALAPDFSYKFPHILAPAGDLCMTPIDFAKYTQLHLQGLRGANNYLSSHTYKVIHYGYKKFSLGVANEVSWGEPISTIEGSAGTFFCSAMIFPESNFGFVIAINSGSEKAVAGVAWAAKKIIKYYYDLWWMFWM